MDKQGVIAKRSGLRGWGPLGDRRHVADPLPAVARGADALLEAAGEARFPVPVEPSGTLASFLLHLQ